MVHETQKLFTSVTLFMRDVKQKIVYSLRPPNITLSHFFLPLKFAELYNYSPLTTVSDP